MLTLLGCGRVIIGAIIRSGLGVQERYEIRYEMKKLIVKLLLDSICPYMGKSVFASDTPRCYSLHTSVEVLGKNTQA